MTSSNLYFDLFLHLCQYLGHSAQVHPHTLVHEAGDVELLLPLLGRIRRFECRVLLHEASEDVSRPGERNLLA
jgi:hypothetical protein